MTTYQKLLMDSATLRQIEQVLEDHNSVSIADEAKEARKTINEIKEIIKQRYEK